MSQKFYASADVFTWPNGAVGHRPGGSFDCLGPYAIVRNCPLGDSDYRVTAYATGYADTYFSVPACTYIRRQYIRGFFSQDAAGIRFVPYQPVAQSVRQATALLASLNEAQS